MTREGSSSSKGTVENQGVKKSIQRSFCGECTKNDARGGRDEARLKKKPSALPATISGKAWEVRIERWP